MLNENVITAEKLYNILDSLMDINWVRTKDGKSFYDRANEMKYIFETKDTVGLSLPMNAKQMVKLAKDIIVKMKELGISFRDVTSPNIGEIFFTKRMLLKKSPNEEKYTEQILK